MDSRGADRPQPKGPDMYRIAKISETGGSSEIVAFRVAEKDLDAKIRQLRSKLKVGSSVTFRIARES